MHTKGPWYVTEGQGCARVRQSVPVPCVPVLNAIIYGNNWRNDADLIASAPEMLEALEHVEQNLSEQSEETFEHELAHIRHAIRKAKGE